MTSCEDNLSSWQSLRLKSLRLEISQVEISQVGKGARQTSGQERGELQSAAAPAQG